MILWALCCDSIGVCCLQFGSAANSQPAALELIDTHTKFNLQLPADFVDVSAVPALDAKTYAGPVSHAHLQSSCCTLAAFTLRSVSNSDNFVECVDGRGVACGYCEWVRCPGSIILQIN